MFKVISRTNLIQNVPVVKANGEDCVVCIPPKGTIFTRRITPALQYLIDNKQVSVIESNENLQQNSVELENSSTGIDTGSLSESINITEFNSEEEKEQIESSTENQSKKGRRKKNNGGDS